MTERPESPAKDKNYNLISAVHDSLQNVYQMSTYIADAESQGDSELAEWFRKIQHNNKKAAEQGKQMLLQRLQKENG